MDFGKEFLNSKTKWNKELRKREISLRKFSLSGSRRGKKKEQIN